MFLQLQLQVTSLLFTPTRCCWVVVYRLPEQELVEKTSKLQCPFGAMQTSFVNFGKGDTWGYTVV